MKYPQPEFVVDEKNNRKAVIVSYREWRRIVELLEELDEIKAYDAAKAQDDELVPFEDAVAEIRRRS